MLKKRSAISLILACALIVTSTFSSYATTSNVDATVNLPELPATAIVKTFAGTNGEICYVKSYEKNGIKRVEVSSDGSDSVMVITNDNSEILTIDEYTLASEGISNSPSDDMYLLDRQEYNLEDLNNTGTIQGEAFAAMTYASKKYETYENKYYYAIGESSYGNAYLKIGCIAEYQLKYWTLSSSQQDRCDSYTQNIRDVRAHMYNFKVGCGADYVAALALCSDLALLLPPAGVIAAVGATLTIGGFAVQEYLNAKADYEDASYYYSIIKKYPQL